MWIRQNVSWSKPALSEGEEGQRGLTGWNEGSVGSLMGQFLGSCCSTRSPIERHPRMVPFLKPRKDRNLTRLSVFILKIRIYLKLF